MLTSKEVYNRLNSKDGISEAVSYVMTQCELEQKKELSNGFNYFNVEIEQISDRIKKEVGERLSAMGFNAYIYDVEEQDGTPKTCIDVTPDYDIEAD